MDNVYPGSTEFRFGVKPVARDVEDEYQATLDQLPLLKAELERIEARMAATDSIAEASALATREQIDVANALIVLKTVNSWLSFEKATIEGRVKAIAKRKR